MSLDGQRVLALVPARGGSARIPGKNLKTIGGRSLVRLAVDIGLAVAQIDEVIVSSDAPEILAEGRSAGATVDHRSAALARPDTESRDVIDELLARRSDVDVLVLLQPTSPLRTPADVVACLDALAYHPTAATVTRTDHPSAWTRIVSEEGRLLPAVPADCRMPPAGPEVRLNGAVYTARASHIRAGGDLVGEHTAAVMMPRARSVDIDRPFDLHLARLLASSPFEGEDDLDSA
ncbi:MAG TPA: acylneuraminate cytidylyltransferase family protein [Iamia sp.]|nr:acylneuraminate cytidylyltransferase family protein [Iamia sp.]